MELIDRNELVRPLKDITCSDYARAYVSGVLLDVRIDIESDPFVKLSALVGTRNTKAIQDVGDALLWSSIVLSPTFTRLYGTSLAFTMCNATSYTRVSVYEELACNTNQIVTSARTCLTRAGFLLLK